MKALWHRYRELILYVFFGGVTTLVNWGAYALFADVFRVPYLWATAIAQVLAILTAYITNRTWVFQSRAKGLKGILLEMGRFFSARLVSFVLDMGCMYVGVDLLHFNDDLMKLLSNVVIVIVNYVLSKVFVFRGREKAVKD